MVWDLSINGVNESIYTPSFQLPTLTSYHRQVEAGIEAGNFDIREQFPNYQLHPSESPYMGVRLPPALVKLLHVEGHDCGEYMCWGHLPFWWQSSPYHALRMLTRALEIAIGAPDEKGTPFGWVKVELNLPAMSHYNLALPRVHHLGVDGALAAFIISYFDDGRVAAHDQAMAI